MRGKHSPNHYEHSSNFHLMSNVEKRGRSNHMACVSHNAVSSVIITDSHEFLLFSVRIKSTIVVFKMTKQLSEENGGGPFCQQGNCQG